ncbi:class I SAM-dependent methyltransferase [Alsobacter sp. SYSU M60028]|uniref:Class I SAM-dependent methyltransferase n=1 Tax=Alsobacter ponti TaxID=2962936 RepID=A0ABT1L824_9HYPH|nr:class I SAM-dependent methyltransferase [Alsobacter ponti]MCP8937624.1 class I SAM-dependent methyltransferase [Alsobacter ponti]
MADNTASFSGSIPEFYDRDLGPVFFADWAKAMADRVAAHAPERVLETAAGTGIVTRVLRDRLPPRGSLISTDLNAPMLEVARRKISPGEKVEFQPADATSLPFGDASFDAVVCQFGIMFFPDKDKGYGEAFRVLKPGGRFHFSVWDDHRYNPTGRIAHQVIGSFFPKDPPPFYAVPYGYTQLDAIRDSVERAGFQELTVEVMRTDHKLASAADFARGLVYGNPTIDQIRARGGVDPDAVVSALTDAFEREVAPRGGLLPLQVILFETRRPN